MNSMHRSRDLLPGNGDLCSQQDRKIIAENKAERAAITAEITALRSRIKRVKRIRKDTPRLLNLLKTELRREYELKHPVKEQQRQRTRRNEPER